MVTTPSPILWTDSYGDEHELLPVGTEVIYNGIENHTSDLDGESAVITGHDLSDTTPYELRFQKIERMAAPDHVWRPTIPTVTIGASCPTCGESVEAPDTEIGNAVVEEFTDLHAHHAERANVLADAVEAVLDGYGKSGQGTRMSQLASALGAYRAVTR